MKIKLLALILFLSCDPGIITEYELLYPEEVLSLHHQQQWFIDWDNGYFAKLYSEAIQQEPGDYDSVMVHVSWYMEDSLVCQDSSYFRNDWGYFWDVTHFTEEGDKGYAISHSDTFPTIYPIIPFVRLSFK